MRTWFDPNRTWSKSKVRLIAAAIAGIALGTTLAGCSDIYSDRRETIALGADDAVAANMVEQMVDPWPPYSNNNNLAFNGERMQRAVECYRADKVTQPADTDTTKVNGSASPSATSGTPCQGQMSSGSAQPASAAAGSGGLIIALPGSSTAAAK